MRHAEYLDELRHDVVFALRQLAANRLFALVSILTLAVGIGATVTMFAVLYGIVLKPFPYRDANRLAVVWERNQAKGEEKMYASPPNFNDWRAMSRSFEQVAAFTPRPLIVAIGDEPERVGGTAVSADLLPMLGVKPAAGRLFVHADDRPGAPHVTLISHGLWQRRLGGSPGVLGSALKINGTPHVVVGIMPDGFSFPPPITILGKPHAATSELWVPLAIDYADARMRGAHYLTVLARLRPGVGLEAAGHEMDALAGRIAKENPINKGWDVTITGLVDQVSGDVRPALTAGAGAVGFVLLLACANVANLILMRSVGRHTEVAIRASLGAGRWRLVRQMLAESLVLATLGTGAGVMLALWGIRAVVAVAPSTLPRLGDVRLDPVSVAFAVLVMLGVAVVCGLVPALQAARGGVATWLRERGGGEQRRSRAMRNGFVVSQVALAVTLLVGAGLLITSFRRLSDVDPGFNPANVLTVRTMLPRADYADPDRRVQFVDQALTAVAALPGMKAAGATLDIPFSTDRQGTAFWMAGETDYAAGLNREMNFTFITPGYFHAIGMRLLAGRGLTADDRKGRPPVVVINEAFARRYFPGQNAVGKRVVMGYSQDVVTEIVGIVRDERHVSLREPPIACAYASYLQYPTNAVTFVARSAPEPSSTAGAVRVAIRKAGPSVPIFDVKTMSEVVETAKGDSRFVTRLFAVFASVALLLAAVGLYGVMSYAVIERRREIGIRVALGARPLNIARAVMGRGFVLAGAGIAIGLLSARFLTRFLSSMLFAVAPTDAATFSLVATVVAAAALAASWLPARRALGVDPAIALRDE